MADEKYLLLLFDRNKMESTQTRFHNQTREIEQLILDIVNLEIKNLTKENHNYNNLSYLTLTSIKYSHTLPTRKY